MFFYGGLRKGKAGFWVAMQSVAGTFLNGLFGNIKSHFHNVEMLEAMTLLHAIRWAHILGLHHVKFQRGLFQPHIESKQSKILSPTGHIVQLIKQLLIVSSSFSL